MQVNGAVVWNSDMIDFLLKAVLLVCVHSKSDEILPQTCSEDELDFMAAAVCVTAHHMSR